MNFQGVGYYFPRRTLNWVVDSDFEYFKIFISYTVNGKRRKLHMVGTKWTVGKRAKRMLDPTGETTTGMS